jgi:hypothetical protein
MKRKLKKVQEPIVSKQELNSHEIIVDVFGGDKMAKLQNQFMHSADVFEGGKQFATYMQLTVTGNPDLDKLCERIKDSFEQIGGYIIFAGIKSIDGVRVDKPRAYFKEGVQTISNGHQFGLFRDKLITLGYTPETNKHMMVTAVN